MPYGGAGATQKVTPAHKRVHTCPGRTIDLRQALRSDLGAPRKATHDDPKGGAMCGSLAKRVVADVDFSTPALLPLEMTRREPTSLF